MVYFKKISIHLALHLNRFILVWIFAWVIMGFSAFAQSDAEQVAETYHITIRKATDPIKLDGRLGELSWEAADRATNCYQNFPYDTAFCKVQTVAMVTYDENFLYIGAICYDSTPGDYTVQSLKRDFSYPVTDAFAVYIDPFNDKSNGFCFGVSPLGVQREGLLENGGNFGVTTSWDNRWFSEVKIYENRWEVEMAIPFKSIRYNEGNPFWRINFSRNNLKENENGSWVPVPRNFNIAALTYTGLLEWDSAPPKAGTNVSIIPYGLTRYEADYEAKTQNVVPNAGLDAKIAVTSALNLDLTVNADFSQVEVDRQVTNLSRFSLFFPERRQFFIENSDLFANFGFRAIRPFFSRRIGLSQGTQVPILAGARLSGKLNRNWRIGLMNMQTEGVSSINQDAQNYTVAVAQRQIFGTSNISAIFVNRQAFIGFKPNGEDFNRVLGLDYNLNSKNNRWRGKFFYHYSMDGKTKKDKGANAAWLMYNSRKLTVAYNHEFVEQNYNAEVGFVPRLKYFRLEPSIDYRIFPKNGAVISHGPSLYSSIYWDNKSWQMTDREIYGGYSVSFNNRSELEVGVDDWYLYLTFPFDPTGSGATPLPDSVGYKYRALFASYSSDFRKKLNYTASANYGTYFTGEKLTYQAEVFFRAQPWGIFSLALEQNHIQTADTSVLLTLISPRFDLSFSRSLFFTTFFQYNTQQHNFNINARFQWRFKPMSDLFIVLTDNYATPELGVKNRAIVLKLNYWFTL